MIGFFQSFVVQPFIYSEYINMNITFAPLTKNHFSLLLEWLKTAHVRQWWDHDIDWTPKLIAQKFAAYIDGYKLEDGKRKPLHAYIINIDEQEIGYIQYYNVHDFPLADTAFELPPSLAGLDIFIGDINHIGKGIGALILSKFIRIYIDPSYNACFVDPDISNIAAIRAYEKVGFQQLKTCKEGKELWMLRYRPKLIKPITGLMACDSSGVIGKNGKLPWFYEEELEHFRRLTYGQVIIMGHKTFTSLPKKILQDRFNIVFSHDLKPNNNNIIFVSSLAEFLSLDSIPQDKQLFMIGGATIAHLFLTNNLISEFLLTKIKVAYSGDTFFPLDLLKDWLYIPIKEQQDFTVYKYFNPQLQNAI